MWLLEPDTLNQFREVVKNGWQPTAEQQSEVVALFGSNSDGTPKILTKAGRHARIAVTGVLTQSPNIMALFFGGGNTLYPEIQRAAAQADADEDIDEIEFFIDSPGGSVDGLFDTVAALQTIKTKTVAKVGAKAASAGYILAAAANEITATNRASAVGSFGVAVDLMFRADVERVSITNTASPDKRPDLQTEEGQAVVREHLDALYDLFAESVASGRKTTVETINAKFGAGRMFLADEAQRRGMIDRVDGTPSLRVVEPQTTTAAQGGTEPEAIDMDLEKLKAQHPDVYAAAVKVGADSERDRVTAHLTMGEASGDMATAVAAVKDGSDMTASLQAKYMAAGMNRSDINKRGEESDAAAAAAAAAAGAAAGETAGDEDAGDRVASEVEALMGVGV